MKKYILKLVTPDGRKYSIEHHNKKELEGTRKAALEMNFRKATIKKIKKKK